MSDLVANVAALKAFLRKGGDFHLRFERDPAAPSYLPEQSICEIVRVRRTRAGEERETLRLPNGRISGGRITCDPDPESYFYHGADPYLPSGGSWSLLGSEDHFRAAIDSLSAGSDFRFDVRLDSQTNGYLYRNRLHGDALVLWASRKAGKRIREVEFLVDVSTLPHNSARFGCPRHETDRGDFVRKSHQADASAH